MRKDKKIQEDSLEGDRTKSLTAKTQNQKNYILSIIENDITFCFGPSGTGKSFVAAGIAAQHLNRQKTSQIIVTRPLVCAGKSLGAVPGEIEDKVKPYLKPMEENLKFFLGNKKFKKLMDEDIIKFEPLELMRGASFHNSYMILDEAQNCTLDQIKMFITRIGENSKVIINGDVKQTDLKDGSGLRICINKLTEIKGVGICEFNHNDIQRNSIISSILVALEDEQDFSYSRPTR
ncbi:PhoH family protein [Candidatus Marinimicrobia bacterium]|jgi:phosphate starvation-inducible PhoH-like protein|nr:PhoH family protein [Candidatus Neomarinimicrobiota bacterium]